MYIFVVIIHVIVCIILMGVILLQAGKGAEMGAAFGGSSQTIFGSRGAATFLSKITVGAAALFMITSLTLSILSRERSVASTVTDGAAKDDLIPKQTPAPGGPVTLPTNPPANAPAAPAPSEGKAPAEPAK
ncbi:MAG TPA: preprotein translocase subunit SecG [Candidatus Manganitrophaceae bacterium]|nr:preprotein translocase subunit SecG [Candidatus Manganitrophaceae bacterium]